MVQIAVICWEEEQQLCRGGPAVSVIFKKCTELWIEQKVLKIDKRQYYCMVMEEGNNSVDTILLYGSGRGQ